MRSDTFGTRAWRCMEASSRWVGAAPTRRAGSTTKRPNRWVQGEERDDRCLKRVVVVTVVVVLCLDRWLLWDAGPNAGIVQMKHGDKCMSASMATGFVLTDCDSSDANQRIAFTGVMNA